MVTLLELQKRAREFKHLDSGLPSLGIEFTSAIYDFQTTPSKTGHHPMLANLMVSHLAADESHKVILVQTLHPFLWLWLQNHPSYDKNWQSDRIRCFVTNSFAQLFTLFSSEMLKNAARNKCLVIVANFHETAQHYKLQLSAACEEALLKFHITRNSAALLQQTHLPELPPSSNLLRENPSLKFQSHVSGLTSLISQFAYSTNLVCILTGFLITKSLPYSQDTPDSSFINSQLPRSSQSIHSSAPEPSQASFNSQPFKRQTRPVLVPSLDDSDNSVYVKSSFSNYIAARFIFYSDWYHRTPHYKHYVSQPISASSENLRLVQVLEIKAQNTTTASKTLYFDYDQQFYHELNKTQWEAQLKNYHFLDLSEPNYDSQPANIPSSPEISESQLRTLIPDFSLEIEASDDEPSLLQPLVPVLQSTSNKDTSIHQVPDEPR